MRLRGVITSSTVMASRSIRLASIVLCLPRKYWLPSSTSERSSSCVSWVLASGAGLMRSELEQRLHEQVDEPDDGRQSAQQRRQHERDERRDAVRVRGADHLRRDLREHEDQERDRRRCWRRARARPRRTAAPVITPVSVAAPALSRLLPKRMTPSSRSVCASSASASLAPWFAALRAMLQPVPVAAIIAVSAIEKKPDATSSTASAMASVLRGNSSNGG